MRTGLEAGFFTGFFFGLVLLRGAQALVRAWALMSSGVRPALAAITAMVSELARQARAMVTQTEASGVDMGCPWVGEWVGQETEGVITRL